MSYSDFTIERLKESFAIEIVEDQGLFDTPPTSAVPELLQTVLRRYLPLAITISTEKARSEFIIAPILADLKLRFAEVLSLFSGIEFNVDSSVGLNGRCDYVLSKSKEQLVLNAPVLVMVEAKNENITGGIPQCIAEMIAAQKFNQQKHNAIGTVYGVVTTGSLWRFLKLEERLVYVDIVEYPIQQLEIILGILEWITVQS